MLINFTIFICELIMMFFAIANAWNCHSFSLFFFRKSITSMTTKDNQQQCKPHLDDVRCRHECVFIRHRHKDDGNESGQLRKIDSSVSF